VPKIQKKIHHATLCLQPIDEIPEADIVVIHKLMIEADEETYLQKANWSMPLDPSDDRAAGVYG
jgi:hypothetical protein